MLQRLDIIDNSVIIWEIGMLFTASHAYAWSLLRTTLKILDPVSIVFWPPGGEPLMSKICSLSHMILNTRWDALLKARGNLRAVKKSVTAHAFGDKTSVFAN